MNLRCIYCQTPFTLSRVEMLGAIVHMNERHQNHYDAHCPRCRRANSISRQRMELFFPNWREAAKQQASAPAVPVSPAAPPPTPATAMLKTEPLSKAKRAEAGKATAKPTAKKPPAKKTVAAVAKKPAAKKTSSEKTAVKKAPAKGKNT
ncbi:MAG: hypothetical protein HZB18_13220 [Chloroflexi bacterium]|nr:hypothetical protein [Chloroflexota bacterium]